MLVTPGDLIPVQSSATSIPWTRRKSQILNFLHRGPVSFSTLVYDTNVGDISALSTYFNPERVSVKDLNSRFGQYPSSGENNRDDQVKVGTENVLKPRLLLYPEHNLNHSQVKVQRTLKWILSQEEEETDSEGGVDQMPPAVNQLLSFDNLPPGLDLQNTKLGLSSTQFPGLTSGLDSTFKPRMKPIGKPVKNSTVGPGPLGNVGNVSNVELNEPVRSTTMPNLENSIKNVWGEIGPLSGWGVMQLAETSW